MIVVSGGDQEVMSLTLENFDIISGTGTVGARIYDSGTGALIVSADQAVGSGFDQSVTIPISATLVSGKTYRVGFIIVTDILSQGSGDLIDAAPNGYDISAYLDPTGSLQVTQAYSIGADAFPTNKNSMVPMISITVAGQTGLFNPDTMDQYGGTGHYSYSLAGYAGRRRLIRPGHGGQVS